ncbi:Cna B-type domain-containing protein [Streptococcus hyointestinalis]|uniref:Cna B-type domain-containing protein n=1 Tax=Streptococcus hyointestinalis TaxID=1337 RepID=UPI003516110F
MRTMSISGNMVMLITTRTKSLTSSTSTPEVLVYQMVIKDQINSAGLTYVEGSFSISEGTWRKNAQNYWALDNATDVTNNYNIVRSADNNAFSINFGNISKGYSIKYKVKASYDLVNGEQLKNAATYNSNSVQINESKNTVYYQSANGQANGYNYDLTIKKVNETNEPLAGAEFTVTRKSNGQVVGTLTTGADGTATLSGLLKDEYVITETKAPDGYTIADPVTAVADNSTVTITDKRSTIDIAGTKTWDDNNDQDGLRPTSVKINLLANGEVVDSRTVTADDNWSYSFTGLKQYDDNGNQIVYTIAEDPVTGYTSTVDGYNITNTHTPETTEVSGQKTWSDNEDQDGKRPNSVTVNLLANGKQVDSQQVTADNSWAYSFTNLPKYADGKEIVYTVTEDAVDDYTTAINDYDITNSYTPGKTSFTVTKAWDDNNDQDGKRPKTIDVQLYANGEKSGDVVTLSAANNWTYTWTGLAQKAKKKDIVYTVKEVTKVDGYTTTVGNVENGNVTITNTHTPETTEVSGKKTWKDSDDQDGKRPKTIDVQLYANGEKSGDVVTLSAANNWTYTWTGLAQKAKKKDIVYTVKEVTKVDNYTTTVGNVENGNVTITNTHTPKKPTTPTKSSNKKSGFLPSSGSRSGIVLSILGAIIVVGALAGLAYYKVNK